MAKNYSWNKKRAKAKKHVFLEKYKKTNGINKFLRNVFLILDDASDPSS